MVLFTELHVVMETFHDLHYPVQWLPVPRAD